MCQYFDHVTWRFHGNQVLTGRFTQNWCFSFMRFSLFAKGFFQNLYSTYILILFRLFQIKFGDFMTFQNNLEIQDGGFKVAEFLNASHFGVIWRHTWDMTVTKINMFRCFTHHISFIFLASIRFEIKVVLQKFSVSCSA